VNNVDHCTVSGIMTITNQVTRRTILGAAAAGAGTVALAACSSSSGGDNAASQSGDASPSADAGSAGGSQAAARPLATLADLTVDDAIAVELAGGRPGLLTRTGASSAVCFSAICTHQGCTVKPAGATLDCPCHGSKYDAKTGKVLAGPAPSPLPAVPVQIEAGKVVTAG
jgi:Rieske Fe-S protein